MAKKPTYEELEQRVKELEKGCAQRKQTEESLRKSEERLAGIIASVTDHMSLIDEEHNIVWANDVAKRLFGPDLIGKKCYAAYHKSDTVCVSCITDVTFADGKFHEHETEVIGADGKKMIFWCTTSVAARYGDSRPKLVVEVSRDITQRKWEEEALQESEEKYRSLVESTEDSIYLVDRNCTYLFMNKKHLSRFGLPVDKVVGREYGDFHSAEETKEFTKRAKEVFETGKSISHEYRSERDGGYFLRTLSPVKKPDGKITDVTVISKNITERKQAEEDIKSSEVRFRELFNNMSSGVAVYEARDDGNDFIIKDSNRAGELISKVNRENIVGRSVLEVFQRVWKTGEPEYHPVSLYRDDYLSHWAENYVYKLPSGEIVAVFDDVTERKQAEESLKESRDYLERLTNSMWDAVFSVKMPERVIEWVNDSFRLIGYEPSECVGKDTAFLYPDKDNFLDFGNKLKNAMAAGKNILHTEELLKRKSGELFPAEVTVTFFKEKGEVVRITSIVRDITERKRAEEELRESRERYQAIFEQAADSIVLIDAETGALVEFNERAHENLGYTRNQFEKLKIPDFEVIESAGEVARHIEKIVKDGADTFETKHRKKGGEIRDVHVSTKIISIGGREFVQNIWCDITERKQAEEALKQANTELLKEHNQRKILSERLIDLLEKDRRWVAMELTGYGGE